MGPKFQDSIGGLGYGAGRSTMSGRPGLERTESISIARVGTVDQNYERGRRSPLRVVGELTRVVTPGSAVGASMGSRVEEKLKKMREKRRELERV